MRGIRIRRMALVVAGASVVMLATAAVATAQVSGNGASSRHVLAGSKPSWTAAVSASAAQGAIRAKVWLAPRNAAQLDALAVGGERPRQPADGQFISEPAYRAQFAPTAGQVAQVSEVARPAPA